MSSFPTLPLLGGAAAATILLTRFASGYVPGIIATGALVFFFECTVWITWMVIIWPRFFSALRDVPTPPNSGFLLGQTSKVRREPQGAPMREWINTVPNDGLIRYSMWFSERIMPTDPKVLSELLVTKNYDFVKPARIRKDIGRLLGIGILLAEGEEHRMQRKALSPAFTFRHIKDLYPVFWAKSREMVELVGNEAQQPKKEVEQDSPTPSSGSKASKHGSGSIDVGEWASRATLDIIGLCGMGQDFNALQDANNELCCQYRNVFNLSRTGAILLLAGQFIPTAILRLLPLKRNQDVKAAVKVIRQTCRDLIEKKHKVLKDQKGSKDIDIISVALESGSFSDDELVDQLMTFLAAGHETTATALTWAVYAMCKNPSVQKKLRDEVRAKLTLGEDITPAQLDECHYLHACCTEILRLYCPVSLTWRYADKDTSLNGHFIPEGTMVIITPWAINVSKKLWGEDALEFKPERWLDSDGKANKKGTADSNYSFMTFLHGPRSCIGQKFAESEFACLLAAWAGRFETTFEEGSPHAGDEVKVKGGLTMKPEGGLWVNLKEIDGW